MKSKREYVNEMENEITARHFANPGSVQIPACSPLPSGAETSDEHEYWVKPENYVFDNCDDYIARLEAIIKTGKDPKREKW